MEPTYISELRQEIKSELQKFSKDRLLKKLSSVFLGYKFVIGEFVIATVLVSELFLGINNTLLGGFSNIFLFAMISLLILVPVNAALSYIHFNFFKKRWVTSVVGPKTADLVKLEMDEFEKNLGLETSKVYLPNLNYLASLAYFSQEYLLFGPRNERLNGVLDKIEIKIHTSQDYLGYEGRLLVITLISDNEDASSIKCDISYQEKEYSAYTSTKKLAGCLTVPEIKDFVISFFEVFSLRSQGWIKIAECDKSKQKIKIDIIIDDYLPLSTVLYSELKKYLNFFGKSFLDMIKSNCNEKHNI